MVSLIFTFRDREHISDRRDVSISTEDSNELKVPRLAPRGTV